MYCSFQLQDTELHIFSLSNKTLSETKSQSTNEVTAVEYSPDGAYLAFASRNKIHIYNITDWKVGPDINIKFVYSS